ncbi:MAG TPA: hypothetical protein VLT87_25940 [Thermoanaerobaculia bacterium]|jgi:hypothetical protein|nr:hypothetical protein [Thermoanaerobaculia bacterium]
MQEKKLSEHLDFLISQRGQDEATVLAHALRAGIEALYREALIEAYLLGKVPRETALRELGPEQLGEIEYQSEALRRDVEWGRKGA